MSELYSEKVLDHVHNPRNIGSLELANVVVQGCGAAIATSSMATELVMGKHLDEVLLLDDERIAAALDSLPEEKMHCSNMAASALHAAVSQYRSTVAGETPPVEVKQQVT